MRTFKVKRFSKWARSEKITNKMLMHAATEIENGLIDANLGGYILKKRIPLTGRGKSGGARAIIAYKTNDRLFFIYGFSKSDRSNISLDEKRALKEFAHELMSYSNKKIDNLLNNGSLQEITNE